MESDAVDCSEGCSGTRADVDPEGGSSPGRDTRRRAAGCESGCDAKGDSRCYAGSECARACCCTNGDSSRDASGYTRAHGGATGHACCHAYGDTRAHGGAQGYARCHAYGDTRTHGSTTGHACCHANTRTHGSTTGHARCRSSGYALAYCGAEGYSGCSSDAGRGSQGGSCRGC